MFDLFLDSSPSSLAFFVIFSFVVVIVGLVWIRYIIDDSDNYLLPDPNQLTLLEIAALQGGKERVIQTALFALWRRRLLSITGKGTKAVFTRNILLTEGQLQQKKVLSQEEQPQNEVEETIYQLCAKPRKAGEFFNLYSIFDRHLQPIDQTLKNLHLTFNEDQDLKIWYVCLSSVSLILGIGVIKLLLGIRYGYFLGWLIPLLIVISLIVCVALMSKRKTTLGRRFQKKLVQEFKWMGKEKGDPTLYIAIFGPNLPDTEAFRPFNDVFVKEKDSGSRYNTDGLWGGY